MTVAGGYRVFWIHGLTPARERDGFLRRVLAELAELRRGACEPAWFATAVATYRYWMERYLDAPEAVEIARHRQLNVAAAFVLPPPLAIARRVALAVLDLGLTRASSPLYECLRYEHRTYLFDTEVTVAGGYRVFWIHGLTPARERDGFLRRVLAELAELRRGACEPAWFATAVATYRYWMERYLDAPEAVALRLVREQFRPANEEILTIPQEIDFVERMTPADITDLAQLLFARTRFFLCYDGRARPFDSLRVKRLANEYL